MRAGSGVARDRGAGCWVRSEGRAPDVLRDRGVRGDRAVEDTQGTEPGHAQPPGQSQPQGARGKVAPSMGRGLGGMGQERGC